jgi:hypothetical protein
MSEPQPPAATPEYLEYGSGDPIPASPEPADGQGAKGHGRRAWWIGGGVVALLGVGAGAWAALGFFQQGSQPADALPSTTVGYISVDLDPSGGQKIDAFRTMNKFPSFKDEVGIDSVDELRHKLGNEFVGSLDCSGLDYDSDIEPWLGDRMAAAAVPLDGGDPQLVVVVQVTDADKAAAGFAKLNACDDSGEDAGVAIHDGWAVLAESQKVADEVVSATDHGTLADDATYQKWTSAIGDAGVVNAYASPDAGRVLAEQLGGLISGRLFSPEAMAVQSGSSVTSSAYHATTADDADDPITQALSGFRGGAATLRFTGNGLELAVAADRGSPQLSELTGTTGGELVSRLPGDTAAAAGWSLPKGWFSRYADSMSQYAGAGMSRDDLYREIEQETGLDAPDDIDTLLGSGVALSVGKDIDLEALENSDTGSGVPVAATVKGDPAAIGAVLDKVRARVGDLPFLESDSGDGLVVIGPSEEYRKQVLSGGGLGDDETFRDAVPDAADANSLFYVDVDALEPSLTKLAGSENADDLANLTPLRAFGISSRTGDGVIHFSFKVTTN